MNHGRAITSLRSDNLSSRGVNVCSGRNVIPSLQGVAVCLAYGDLWSRQLTLNEAIVIACTHGELWLTMEDDPRDYLLVRCDTHVVSGPGKVIVQALAPATFSWQDCQHLREDVTR